MGPTAIERALLEMTQFGALSRKVKPDRHPDASGGWKSCNGTRFYNCTVMALIAKELAIYSINKNLPDLEFVRLNPTGIIRGRHLIAERKSKNRPVIVAPKIGAEA